VQAEDVHLLDAEPGEPAATASASSAIVVPSAGSGAERPVPGTSIDTMRQSSASAAASPTYMREERPAWGRSSNGRPAPTSK
jgi:hypothetical protein